MNQFMLFYTAALQVHGEAGILEMMEKEYDVIDGNCAIVDVGQC